MFKTKILYYGTAHYETLAPCATVPIIMCDKIAIKWDRNVIGHISDSLRRRLSESLIKSSFKCVVYIDFIMITYKANIVLSL